MKQPPKCKQCGHEARQSIIRLPDSREMPQWIWKQEDHNKECKTRKALKWALRNL